MRHVECLEVDKLRHRCELLNLVVGDPELLQGVTHYLDTGQVLDQVPSETQDLEVLHVVQVGNACDHVGGEAQLLAAGQRC